MSSEAARNALLRELSPQVLGAVARRFADFGACEDAVQEALLAAAQQWPTRGIPENPRGWLIRVALRRLSDETRSQKARRKREAIVVSLVTPDDQLALALDADSNIGPEDELILLFMCCHPTLSPSSAIALTLRAVAGLTTAEIARAFLVPESTMAQRISRAKSTVQNSGVPFERPSAEEQDARLASVLRVLYLVFNEGYAASTGSSVVRDELSSDAIRLTRALFRALPDNCEIMGLLSLMLLTDARRAARTSADGQLIALTEQDRGLWDLDAIAEGVALISRALPRGDLGPYQLQAAIAAVHDEAARVEDTDWPQILALYEVLLRLEESPMARLNHAVAVAMVRGPMAGLALLDALDIPGSLQGHHRLDSVRAHLLERAGEAGRAVAYFRAAAEKTTSLAERHYLMTHAAELAEKT